MMALVGAGPTHQAFVGRFAEGQAKPDARRGGDKRLVDVLNRFDETRLDQHEVDVVGIVDLHRNELHGALSFSCHRISRSSIHQVE
jgi:hypothetical protein